MGGFHLAAERWQQRVRFVIFFPQLLRISLSLNNTECSRQKCGLCPKAWGTWAKGQSPERLTPQSSPQPSLSVWTLPEQQTATGRMVALPNKVTVLGAAAAEKSVHPNNAVCLINLWTNLHLLAIFFWGVYFATLSLSYRNWKKLFEQCHEVLILS